MAFFDVPSRLVPNKAFAAAVTSERDPRTGRPLRMILNAEVYEGRMDLSARADPASALDAVTGRRLDSFEMTIKHLKFNLHNVEGQLSNRYPGKRVQVLGCFTMEGNHLQDTRDLEYYTVRPGARLVVLTVPSNHPNIPAEKLTILPAKDMVKALLGRVRQGRPSRAAGSDFPTKIQ